MSDTTPTKRSSILSEKTLIPLSFVLTLAVAAVSLASMFSGFEKKQLQQDFINSQNVQRFADMQERDSTFVTREELRSREASWSHWVGLLRAQLPPELRNSIPEAPK